LHFAWDQPEISRILIEHGAEVNLADNWMRLDEEMRNVGVLR